MAWRAGLVFGWQPCGWLLDAQNWRATAVLEWAIIGRTSLKPEGKFKAAEAHFLNADEINSADVQRWLAKATLIQWDYKNIVKRKGKLEKIGPW